MNIKNISLLLAYISLGCASPALAQFRPDTPLFFQQGQDILNQEIKRLQQQDNQNNTNNPSDILTINSGSLQWQRFIFRNAGFSVWMPEGVQSQETLEIDTSLGKMTFNLTASHPESFRFVAAYSEDMPDISGKSSEEVLGAVEQGIIAKTQFKLVDNKAIALGEYSGKQLMMENAQETITFRIYLVKDKIYVLGANQQNYQGISDEVAAFLNSFRLL
jgi:hypothetical protein